MKRWAKVEVAQHDGHPLWAMAAGVTLLALIGHYL